MKVNFKIIKAKEIFIYIETGKINSTPKDLLSQIKNRFVVNKHIIIMQKNSNFIILIRGTTILPKAVVLNQKSKDLPNMLPTYLLDLNGVKHQIPTFKIISNIRELALVSNIQSIETNLSFINSKTNEELLLMLLKDDQLLEKTIKNLIRTSKEELVNDFFRAQHIFAYARLFFDDSNY